MLIASGGTGNDLIFGGTSGADQLYTGAGNTTLVGGSGATLTANGGGNVALAADGNNVTLNALAATGNTTLFGGSGSTTIFGGYGTDYAALSSGSSACMPGMERWMCSPAAARCRWIMSSGSAMAGRQT